MSKTSLEKERESEYKKYEGDFDFVVTDELADGKLVRTTHETIDEVLHKVKLDLMSLVKLDNRLRPKISIEVRLKKNYADKGRDHRHGITEDGADEQ